MSKAILKKIPKCFYVNTLAGLTYISGDKLVIPLLCLMLGETAMQLNPYFFSIPCVYLY